MMPQETFRDSFVAEIDETSDKLIVMARHEPNGSKNRSRIWPYVVWGIVALVVGIGGMLGILTFAGISLLPSRLVLLQVPVLVNSAHGQVVAAAVSWFAGTVALFTYFLNRDQKEQHLRAQLDETRNLEAARIKQQQEFEAARERRERDLAELQRLEAEFAALASDFAQPAGLARINAAIGLGEIALKPDPRRMADTGELMEDPREPIVVFDAYGTRTEHPWREEWRSLKTERNYPYFLRAAHRLAAALHQWEDDAPRAQAIRVLKEIGDWAKDEGTDEPLLHALVNALAEANRTAWSLLREQTAMSMAAQVDDRALLALLDIGVHPPIGFDVPRWRHCVDLCKSYLTGGQSATRIFLTYQEAQEDQPEEARRRKKELEERLRASGKSLWATRDALTTSLRTLSLPPDAPCIENSPHPDIEASNFSLNYEEERWKANLLECHTRLEQVRLRRGIDLKNVILFWADCSGAHLQGIVCPSATFIGSSMVGADLSGGELCHASFAGADCRLASFSLANCHDANFLLAFCADGWFIGTVFQNVTLTHATLNNSNFDRASFTQANLTSAKCTGARFNHANLEYAKFSDSNCDFASFRDSNLSTTIMERASLKLARLYGSNMGQADALVCGTRFADREFEVADFHEWVHDPQENEWIKTDTMDTNLYEYLDRMYPRQPDAPDENPPVSPYEQP